MQLCPWLHIMTAQNKTQIFKPTHMHKYPPPSNMNRKLRQTHETRTVLCSGRHFEGPLRCGLLFLTRGKHTGNFYRSTVICKQAHSFPVCLTLFLKKTYTHRHTRWLRGLRAFGARLDLGLQWIIAMMWCMLSILICQRGLGTVLTDEWAGPGRATASLPSLSFLLLRHLSSALSLPWPKQWQVRRPESSLHTAGLRDTAGVNEVKKEPNSDANRVQSLVLTHWDTHGRQRQLLFSSTEDICWFGDAKWT